MMTQPSTAVATNGLSYAYPGHTVQLPDLSVGAGTSCAILGPSGSGKTTLMHLMAGLLTPESGRVEIAGQDIGALAQRDRDRLRGRHIGIVLQQLRLIGALTVLDNLRLAQRLSGGPVDAAAAIELLAGLGLDGLQDRRPGELSQGQAQRVAIARALVHQPTLVLADEPTSSLDDANAEAVLTLLIDQVVGRGAALVVVTHDARIRGRLDQQVSLT